MSDDMTTTPVTQPDISSDVEAAEVTASQAADLTPTSEVAEPATVSVAEPTVATVEPAVAAPTEATTALEATVAQVPSAIAPVAEPKPVAPVPGPPRPGSPAALAARANQSAAVPAAPVAPPSAGAVAAAAFGRADDDGTVFVRMPDGSELSVGQWTAGTPAEGLAFFARKFDDVSVEIDLANRRLRDGKAGADQAAAVVKRGREALAVPSMVGDLVALGERLDALEALVTERQAAAAEAKTAARAATLAAREAIVAEAESLGESTQWKATGERFKTLLEEWKSTARADRGAEQELWKRFSHARSAFDKHRRQHFAKLDGERSEAKQVKESIAAEAEALATSTDWGTTAAAYRDLMARWKAAGRAGKADEDQLWNRFRTAQDAFFAGRNSTFEVRDAGQKENLDAKLELITAAEAIDTSNVKAAKAALRDIQDRWEKVGQIPRGDKERIEARLHKVEDNIRKSEQDQWRKSNPESRARADATVTQFSASLDKLVRDRDKAEASGDQRKVADLQGRIDTTETLLAAAKSAAADFA